MTVWVKMSKGVEGIQKGNPGSDREASGQTEFWKTQESNKLVE